MTGWGAPLRVDVAVAGAGIVGLAVAAEAARRGQRVAVVDRDLRARGASVRNFGHVGTSVQSGLAADYAELSRSRWLELRTEAGLQVDECGTLVIARSSVELDVIAELANTLSDSAHLLSPDEVRNWWPVATQDLAGGLLLPRDLRVDPRSAAAVLAGHLQATGVDLRYGVTALAASPGLLQTTAGDIEADVVVLALGHDLDRVLPPAQLPAGLTECTLHMLRVAAPHETSIGPALLTGTSMLRYGAFAACPSLPALRAHLERTRPQLLQHDVNLMLTQHPSGDLIIGDTHVYGRSAAPFADEELDELLLDETRALLGVAPLRVTERWRGTYAYAPDRDFLLLSPAPGVRAVAVTSGVGMTTAFGLAQALLDDVATARPQLVP